MLAAAGAGPPGTDSGTEAKGISSRCDDDDELDESAWVADAADTGPAPFPLPGLDLAPDSALADADVLPASAPPAEEWTGLPGMVSPQARSNSSSPGDCSVPGGRLPDGGVDSAGLFLSAPEPAGDDAGAAALFVLLLSSGSPEAGFFTSSAGPPLSESDSDSAISELLGFFGGLRRLLLVAPAGRWGCPDAVDTDGDWERDLVEASGLTGVSSFFSAVAAPEGSCFPGD